MGLAIFPLIGLPAGAGPVSLTNLWLVPIGSSSETCPAVGADGTIYFGTFDHRLWALNPDGSRKWLFGNTAHLPNLEHPAEFNRIVLEFLAIHPFGH